MMTPSAAAAAHSMAVMTSSQGVEYYTPAHIIAAARSTLGGIDLDPSSCAEANRTVGAARYYTKESNGLMQPWSGRVWLNPPFGGLLPAFVHRLHHDYARGDVSAALLLVPARVDTRWWRLLRDYPVCFVSGRLRFSDQDNSAPFATAIIYLGPHSERFTSVFRSIGLIYQCIVPASDDETALQGLLPLGSDDAPATDY